LICINPLAARSLQCDINTGTIMFCSWSREGSAQHELAQAGVPATAHHQQVGAVRNGLMRQRPANIGMSCDPFRALAPDVVTRQTAANVHIELV
jgi:hypothetical protein